MKRRLVVPSVILIAAALCVAAVMRTPEPAAERYTPAPPHPEFPTFPHYDFIEYGVNQLQFPGKKDGWNRLFDHLDQLVFEGDTTFSIVHMGGSHVQAGTLSDGMRERFLSLADGIRGERGFLFPYSLAKTNGPRNYPVRYSGQWDSCKNSNRKDHCDWGLSGYNATTQDVDATLKLWSYDRDSVNYHFTRVKVFHQFDDHAYRPVLGGTNIVVNVTVNLDAGYTEFELAQPCDTLFFELAKTDSVQHQFTLQGFSLENDDPGLTYHAVGVNGASVPSFLRAELLPEQLELIGPDLVIFGIGINDAYMPADRFSSERFTANYDTLISYVRAANPNAQLLFLTNNDSYYRRRYPNKNAEKVREGMMELARKYDGAVWDLYGLMGGLNSVRTWERAGLAKSDKIHFTRDGYRLQADLLFKAFRKEYGNHLADLNSISDGRAENPSSPQGDSLSE